jgi:hypothetical protein
MANTVNSSDIWVDQMLHGYAGGHRLLSGSVKLHDSDARSMLVYSDASTTQLSDPDHGYITGYPLAEGAKYVVARTWPAPEMSRPGCVWTHSILIAFADLATLTSARSLLTLFRRPDSVIGGYDQKILLSNNDSILASSYHPRAAALLDALYLEPTRKVEMLANDPFEDEELILAIWLQQWPRLRRSFRFCSTTGADRSTPNEPFDLQVVTNSSPAKRSLTINSITVGDGVEDSRLSSVLADLRCPSNLRLFLRRFGGDVPNGRAAMLALCQLHDALERADQGEISFDAALDALESLGAKQARAARTMVLEYALSHVESVNKRTFHFICDYIAHNQISVDSSTSTRLGAAIWHRSPTAFTDALADDGNLGIIALFALSSLDSQDLADGVVKYPEIAATIARARKDVLSLPRFWIASIDVGMLLNTIEGEQSNSVLCAIISAGRTDAATEVIQKFGAARTLEAIGAPKGSSSNSDHSLWLDWIARDPISLGAPLSSGQLTRDVVINLAERLNPNDVPNDHGDDPWAIGAQASGSLTSYEENRFAAFLMVRALGHRSRSCAELLQISFDRVHNSLKDGSMPRDGWLMIENMLPWPMFWGEWDKCQRVCEAVTAKFVDLKLNPVLFVRMSESDNIFRCLAGIAAKTRSGRYYLKQVCKAVKNDQNDLLQARSKILMTLI